MVRRLTSVLLLALACAAALPVAAPAHEGEEHAGWDVRVLAAPREAGMVDPLRFEVRTAAGAPVTSYDDAHARKLHAWLVRTDAAGRLSDFQHVHPSRIGGGTWELNDGTFPSPGTWNLVIDATSRGVQGFGTAMFEVGGTAPRHAEHAPDRTHGHVARIIEERPMDDGTSIIRVRISTTDGAPVTDVQTHVGAVAHWTSFVARASGVRGTVHAHAMGGIDSDGVIEFNAAPPGDDALADANGGWIELRTAADGVCVLPLRPRGAGARRGDGLGLRLHTLFAQLGAVDASPAPVGDDMAGMDHGGGHAGHEG
ncbi:MAG: putative secreted protein [Thermoleophilia bacterium]|nr:putative secreted protein [Thermoleophilia bacterium]